VVELIDRAVHFYVKTAAAAAVHGPTMMNCLVQTGGGVETAASTGEPDQTSKAPGPDERLPPPPSSVTFQRTPKFWRRFDAPAAALRLKFHGSSFLVAST